MKPLRDRARRDAGLGDFAVLTTLVQAIDGEDVTRRLCLK